MMDGLKTLLTEGQRLLFTGARAWIKRNKWIETGTATPIQRLASGKRRQTDITEEDDLSLARAKQVTEFPLQWPKEHEYRRLRPADEHF